MADNANEKNARSENVFSDVNVDEARNENLQGRKSTQAHPEEAKAGKMSHEQKHSMHDRQPDEDKATKNVLPKDAELKSENSGSDSSS